MKQLTDRQFAEIEISILTLRNRAERLRVRYAQAAGFDPDDYANGYGDVDSIYDALNAAAASLEEAYELLV